MSYSGRWSYAQGGGDVTSREYSLKNKFGDENEIEMSTKKRFASGNCTLSVLRCVSSSSSPTRFDAKGFCF